MSDEAAVTPPEVSDDTRPIADTFDGILAKVVASSGRPSLLAPGTELAGRFRIESVLGAGGMGTVYIARDLTLSRDVAIKVHHAAAGGDRLRREAVAMARLAHPNVVTVFEVGELDGHPFVVMEYVVGTTLRAWLADAPRTTHERLAKLLEAGEGLAASHDAGLVHRDIKPENVLIGADGRARVGDFGLARDVESAGLLDAGADTLTSITMTGAVLGTPPYMAPEQFAAGIIDARSDQFAFCVTAWEVLYGARPFAGDTFAELQTAITAGKLPAARTGSAAIRAVLERGLAVEPAARHADMHALLVALRAATRRRWRALAAGGTALAIAGVVVALASRSAEAPCEGTQSDLSLPIQLPVKLVADGKLAVANRVEREIVETQLAYVGFARLTCGHAAAHDWSPQLVSKSLACIDGKFRASRRELENATGAIELRPFHACVRPSYLEAMAPLPEDPVAREALLDARADLDVALQEVSHHSALVAPRLARLDASAARDNPEIAAGTEFLHGVLALDAGKLDRGIEQLADAYYRARAIDDDELIAAAIAELVGAETNFRDDHAAAAMWVRSGLADAERGAARTPWSSARLYLAAAEFAETEGDGADTITRARRARELDPTVEAAALAAEGGALLDRGDREHGKAAFEQAIASATQVGGHGDSLGRLLSNYASALIAAGDEEDAVPIARRAIAELAGDSEGGELLADARLNLGAALLDANHIEEAAALLDSARDAFVIAYGDRSLPVAQVDTDLSMVSLNAHDYPHAVAQLRHALAVDEELLGKDHLETAATLYNLSSALRLSGDLPGARETAARTLAIVSAKIPGSPRHLNALNKVAELANDAGDAKAALAATTTALALPPSAERQTTAWTQFERGRVLIALHRPAEARQVLASSRAAYAALNMTARVAMIDKLLAGLQ